MWRGKPKRWRAALFGAKNVMADTQDAGILITMPGQVSTPLQRAARILEIIAAAPEGLSLSDVAERVGLPMPSALRLLRNLVDIGFVATEGRRARYRLGGRLQRMFQMSISTERLRSMCEPEIQALADRLDLTAYLARYADERVDLVCAFMPRETARTSVHPGQTFPINATAVGRVLFAHQPDDVIERVLAEPMRKFRPRTATKPAEVKRALAEARAKGYALSDDELDEATLAVAVPVPTGEAGIVFAIGLLGLRDPFLETLSIANAVTLLNEIASRLGPQLASLGNGKS